MCIIKIRGLLNRASNIGTTNDAVGVGMYKKNIEREREKSSYAPFS